ncbi:MAG: redox-sensing transcriptional repressor Rex, partial [Ilumatobacteraceae bacterium]
VAAIVDIDEKKVGSVVGDIRVQHVNELATIIRELSVSIGVIATPAGSAQVAADLLVAAGIGSILNFASNVLSVPEHISVRSVDLGVELQILGYYEQLNRREVAACQ